MLRSKPASDVGIVGAIIEGTIDVNPNLTAPPQDQGGDVHIKGGYLYISPITGDPSSADCYVPAQAGGIIPRIDITNRIYQLYVCAGADGWYYIDLTKL